MVTNYQAQNFPERTPEGTRLNFDRVLLDAPCSGEGRFRLQMRPEEQEKMQPYSEDYSMRMMNYQLQMLRKAYRLLRPGGILVYSTCTYSPWENEAVVDAFLQETPEAILEDAKLPYNLNLAPGITEWKGQRFSMLLQRCIRVYPHMLNSWGFFVAKIRRPD